MPQIQKLLTIQEAMGTLQIMLKTITFQGVYNGLKHISNLEDMMVQINHFQNSEDFEHTL